MNAKKFWLTVFVSSLALTGVVVAIALVSGGGAPVNKVDLEQVTDIFVKSATGRDLTAFENALNEKKIYPPGDKLSCAWADKGASVVCYVDKNANALYDKEGDDFVFKLEVQRQGTQNYVVAGDGYNYHRHSMMGDIATVFLVNAMFTSHWGYYGGWRSYNYSYVSPGYYRQSYGSASRGYGGRSSVRSGGWSGGK
jgi:hypothetical protein